MGVGHYGRNNDFPPTPPNKPVSMPSGRRRDIDNRPSWMTTRQSRGHSDLSNDGGNIVSDKDRKKARQWVVSALVLNTNTSSYTQPMPLDVDNGLPGVELWFGSNDASEVGFMCHLDTCAAMNTGNLRVHQWLITKHPEIVAEYLQYDDKKPFEPLQLLCAVKDLQATESEHGKLTAIVRYKLRYKQSGKQCYLSFGLGADVTVNSIIGLPTLRQWGGVFDFSMNTFIAKSINTKFNLQYEATAQGLPLSIIFTSDDFVRPHCSKATKAISLVSTAAAPKTHADQSQLTVLPSNTTINSNKNTRGIVTETHCASHLKRSVNLSHLL